MFCGGRRGLSVARWNRSDTWRRGVPEVQSPIVLLLVQRWLLVVDVLVAAVVSLLFS